MTTPAETCVPIHDLIAARRSPRAFDERPVDRELIVGLLEAARWAASSRNAQPWNFLVATRDDPDEYARMLACLSERNQRWAGRAPVLMITVATVEEADGRHNRFAWHDVGLAVGNLSIQAMACGLHLRQMGGFSADTARETYAIPATHEPVTALAIGYPAAAAVLPDDLRERELSPRERKPLEEIAFSGSWGQASFVLIK
jgi:nitroreductase